MDAEAVLAVSATPEQPAGAPDEIAEIEAIFANAFAAERAARVGASAPGAHDPLAERLTREAKTILRQPKAAAPAPAASAASGEPLSDADWFKANPGRKVRLRERREGDPDAYWLPRATAGTGVMTVVRPWPSDFSRHIVALDATGGRRPVDRDADLLAAVRATGAWVNGRPRREQRKAPPGGAIRRGKSTCPKQT